jgi:hypothetical protein
MSHTARILSVILASLALGLVAGASSAATYHGRSVDGRRYQGSILNYDYGLIDGVEVKFHAEHAFVYLRGGGRVVLILQDEDIADPHRIPAEDPQRGVVWEISVTDLTAR